jgi:hypothetical protein
MSDFQIPTEQQSPRRSWIFPALLLIAGVLIGVILTSDLGWLPTGHAVPEPASSSGRDPGLHGGAAHAARRGWAEFRRCRQSREAGRREHFCDAERIERGGEGHPV